MSNQWILTAATGTDTGRTRDKNQDSVFAFVRPRHLGKVLALLIVADGMGGYQGGEIASKMAIDTITEQLLWFLERDEMEDTRPVNGEGEDLEEATQHLAHRLQLAIIRANDAICAYSLANPQGAGNMGTTVTAALIYDTLAIIANVGDSRTYHYRNETLTQITQDHSYVSQLIKEGQLDAEEVYDHPRRNIITRALGQSDEGIEVDIFKVHLQGGDQLLLCSDGVWEMVQGPARLGAHLKQLDPEKAIADLIDDANVSGGADNIGLVIAHLHRAIE